MTQYNFTMISLICPQCKCEFETRKAYYDKAVNIGAPKYCGRVCAGLGRRSGKSEEQKKKEKAEYDKKYREIDKDIKKQKKANYFQRTYDPAKAAIERKKRMPKHIEYCRQPEYKKKKKEYDEKHRAKQNYGEFWESAIILKHLENIVDSRLAKNENNLINKSQKRKRLWKQILQQRT